MATERDKPALLGGRPAHTRPWPSWPMHGAAERRQILQVLESGKWWYGKKVELFERTFARYQGARHAITTSSGTAALEASLIACGVGAGHEVITTPYTFVATATAILRVNAVPVFVDIEPGTGNLDPDLVEKAITSKTAAILPVHFAGLPCDMDRLRRIARAHGLKLVEDACHAWGGRWRGKGLGAVGDIGAFSFQMSKNLTAGEGGLIVTNDPALADTARSFVHVGRQKAGQWYEHFITGTNLRMTEWQAAILLAQLKRYPRQLDRRQRNAALLDRELSQIEGVEVMRREQRGVPRSYHLYLFRIEEHAFGLSRDRLIECLNAEGIPCHGGYPFPLYRNPLFQQQGTGARLCPTSCPYYGKKIDYRKVRCPQAEQFCRDVVWLKHFLLLGSQKDMRDIATAVLKIRRNAAALR